ncbi:peptidase S24 [Flavobacterium rivuli WB 3.3-2 = DSM 21788]|uniref:Peptidase S24 n=2 Tax=Flavobacterium rivuli TaxID=498301 RepID=A0A0A2M9U1_9FLAO|nr:peptidase S24 [Flavobacterium rivuli WB 3.3-2 = DSM 21788]
MTRGVLDKETGISEDNIAKFLAYAPNVNAIWLITGAGKMLLSDINVNSAQQVNEPQANYNEDNKVFKLRTDRNVKQQSIPLYNIEASAGIVQLFKDGNENEPIDYIKVPNLPKCDGAVYITGDSMYPLLKSGDIVMYKTVNNINDSLFFGEMYLVSLDVDGDEFISVKWLHKSEHGDDYIRLVSENRHHSPKDVKLKHVRAMALVKGSIRINSMF